MAYLGHVISKHGVAKPDPKETEAVKKFPWPKNDKNLKQCLARISEVSRTLYTTNFSKTTKP